MPPKYHKMGVRPDLSLGGDRGYRTVCHRTVSGLQRLWQRALREVPGAVECVQAPRRNKSATSPGAAPRHGSRRKRKLLGG
eukprot:6637104-Pyramimonas_sp.AAC.1